MIPPAGARVAEIQGLYGPLGFSERLLQKIWLRGDFDRGRAATTDGRSLRVADPGRWNPLGGPDFRRARLRFGEGRESVGDVEAHLWAEDWDAHGHAFDPAYDGVALHLTLFPPPEGWTARKADGRTVPTLVLLPLLLCSLEEFAADEAVETLAALPAPELPEGLAGLDAAALDAALRVRAESRWRRKVRFAGLRLERMGWERACHAAALEILGYRRNRAPMLRIAARFPLERWAEGGVRPVAALETERGAWRLQGLRPANFPRRRLEQYAAWTRARPGWPGDLARWGRRRRSLGRGPIPPLRASLASEVTAGAVGGGRLDNLAGDGFLPLLAVSGEDPDACLDLWLRWPPGDQPSAVRRWLRHFGLPPSQAAAQGLLEAGLNPAPA